ncbi:efflux RND transporter periplasmic adaptor subunit [Gammaproteobacteria bacterium]|nr:efflux RND transporter periplasmic adaptor subunit [Gammaproteobacteria bacterium]MDC3180500.1 efflux RND transporter periplasmic adaptor subunit [bacterium]MDA8868154.1 efflux RND transporter periplasmic adaptor subunit [Gammaproteobacteria bacterium]MDA8925699.1 efflux RND transporter periplasmic adaptor subunit [Gammaproteobacteria bacterium]MDA8997551.1 efflux RND transporter periplasmic adaptor subunit [Gammaproteobacteria bacterium]|tara:strand:+ start:14532 stop:15515 length:984 start_codon:yes stop_codon:yes gene_type:complete
MNIKKINNTVIAFLLSNTFLSNLEAIEVLEIKMLDEYAITREFPGKLIPSNQSRLAFEIPGKINSINVDIGDEVILGDELASLDDREALAQLNQSKAKFDLAEQVLARYIDLRADGHISTQDLDKAESDQIVAKSQYDFYRVKFEQTKLLAPFNGIIQNRFLDTGSVINAGVQVLEILGSSNVEARISIPMNYMNKVKIGEEYEFDIRGISAKAKLERLAPMSTGGSNNRLAIFRFNTFFNPGSIVKLKLSMTEKAKGTWVPIKSLSQSEQGIWAIYTINEQQVVVRDLVDVIYFEDEYAFVSGTLNNGDLVILGGAQKTIEGKIIK